MYDARGVSYHPTEVANDGEREQRGFYAPRSLQMSCIHHVKLTLRAEDGQRAYTSNDTFSGVVLQAARAHTFRFRMVAFHREGTE